MALLRSKVAAGIVVLLLFSSFLLSTTRFAMLWRYVPTPSGTEALAVPSSVIETIAVPSEAGTLTGSPTSLQTPPKVTDNWVYWTDGQIPQTTLGAHVTGE